MSAVLDISEQRRVEELSRASQERLQASARLATVGEMASLLSHELNQPLAAIASYATGSLNLLQQARRRRARPTCSDGHAPHRRAGRPRRPVIKSVHDFVRRRDQAREAGGAAGAARRGAAAGATCRRASSACGSKAACADGLPRCCATARMVEQVLLNLARNAHAGDGRGRAWPSAALVLQVRRRAGAAARRRPALARVLGGRRAAPASPTRWRRSCSRPSSPPRPRAWAWA